MNVCITRKMKQLLLTTLLVVTLASFAYAEDETKIEESNRSYGLTDTGKTVVAAILLGVGFVALGGGALLQGGGSRRKGYQLGSNYKKGVLNFPDNDRIVNGISNVFFEHDQLVDSGPEVTSNNLREKRSTPLKYNKDGTISLICRFSPELCSDSRATRRGRRTRRGGKRLFSLYLKPSAPWGASLDNLRKSAGISVPKSATSKNTKGTRLVSLSLKSPPRPKPQPRLPSNLYTRAFTRFADDVTRPYDQRPAGRIIGNQRRVKTNQRPRPRAVRPIRGRRPHRGRRTPPRPRPKYRRRQGKGKEVFSLFLKPPALKPKFIPGGRFAPPRSENVPLICKFQPKLCGQRGKKIFSLHYKGFKTLFPYAFPLV